LTGQRLQLAARSASGIAVGLVGFLVALEVEVFDSHPAAAVVDVADDLAPVDSGDELHWLVAFGTGCGAARLDSPDDRPALPDGRGVVHGHKIGWLRPGLDLEIDELWLSLTK
jgi:hypothetical protein